MRRVRSSPYPPSPRARDDLIAPALLLRLLQEGLGLREFGPARAVGEFEQLAIVAARGGRVAGGGCGSRRRQHGRRAQLLWQVARTRRRREPARTRASQGLPAAGEAIAPARSGHPVRGDSADRAKTGHGAWRITRSVVLPRNASRTPWCPAVGMAMASTSSSMAASTIDFTTLPDRRITGSKALDDATRSRGAASPT